MADERGAGAAYLVALKQSWPRRSADATGASTSTSPLPLETEAEGYTTAIRGVGARAEKRGSPRYSCQGSVHLREIHTGVATWATFTDVSVKGCYVEIAAGYGVGTSVALKLELNGFRVEALGEVRVCYPSLGMGISFTKVSDANREQLRRLVQSVTETSEVPSSRIAAPSGSAPLSGTLPTRDPHAVLEAVIRFFEVRTVMGREAFLKILRGGH